jgi:hypothetical protein
MSNLTVATDGSISAGITIYNPHDKILHVKEIYTTVMLCL